MSKHNRDRRANKNGQPITGTKYITSEDLEPRLRKMVEQKVHRMAIVEAMSLEASGPGSEPMGIWIDIRHDGWCNRLKGQGPCNCDPLVIGAVLTLGPKPEDADPPPFPQEK